MVITQLVTKWPHYFLFPWGRGGWKKCLGDSSKWGLSRVKNCRAVPSVGNSLHGLHGYTIGAKCSSQLELNCSERAAATGQAEGTGTR